MMSRQRFRVGAAVFAGLALVLVIAESASAQRGRRSVMVFSHAELASLPEVQTELKFSADQQMSAAQIHEQLERDRREMFRGGGFDGDMEEMVRKIKELNRDASAKLNEHLDPQQKIRLRQIAIQVNGPSALMGPDVAEELKLTEEQRTTLAEFPRKTWDAIRDAVDESQSDDERRRIIDDIRTKRDEDMLAVLSTQQRDQFKAMQGEAIEVDTKPLRPRGWRGRDRN